MSTAIFDTSTVGLSQDTNSARLPTKLGSQFLRAETTGSATFVRVAATEVPSGSVVVIPKWAKLIINPVWPLMILLATLIGTVAAFAMNVPEALPATLFGAVSSAILLAIEVWFKHRFSTNKND